MVLEHDVGTDMKSRRRNEARGLLRTGGSGTANEDYGAS